MARPSTIVAMIMMLMVLIMMLLSSFEHIFSLHMNLSAVVSDVLPHWYFIDCGNDASV